MAQKMLYLFNSSFKIYNKRDIMTTSTIIQLILWLGVLAAWISLVIYGIGQLECLIDKVLDRWFEPVSGALKPTRPCWPSYLDKDRG